MVLLDLIYVVDHPKLKKIFVIIVSLLLKWLGNGFEILGGTIFSK